MAAVLALPVRQATEPEWLTVHADGRVQMWDVLDARSFVQATLIASRRIYQPDERDDLAGEGMRIMLELAGRFEPRRDGYDTEGRFSGFAAKYLRLKLEDAYHRLHPEHQLRADPETGKRTYVYGERAASLDAMTAEDPDHQPLLADVATVDPDTVERRLHEEMFEKWTARVKLWSEVGGLYAQGATDADVAAILGMTGDQVKQAKAAIAEALPRIFGGEQA